MALWKFSHVHTSSCRWRRAQYILIAFTSWPVSRSNQSILNHCWPNDHSLAHPWRIRWLELLIMVFRNLFYCKCCILNFYCLIIVILFTARPYCANIGKPNLKNSTVGTVPPIMAIYLKPINHGCTSVNIFIIVFLQQ